MQPIYNKQLLQIYSMGKELSIRIDDSRKISSIQNEFNAVFPYLKLEFFSRPHKSAEGSDRKKIKPPDITLGEFRKIHTSGEVHIVPAMKVVDLEQQFSTVYGLAVQVFRQSGKVWLETTVTDQWTLEEQNAQGMDLSKVSNEE